MFWWWVPGWWGLQEEGLPQLDEDEACHRLDEVLNDVGRPEEERLARAKELCAAQAEAIERCVVMC